MYCPKTAERRALIEDRAPLADIAFASGFSDQSHFARIFTRMVGGTTGDWRRERRI